MFPVEPGKTDKAKSIQLLSGAFLLSLLVILLIQFSGLFHEQERNIANAIQEEFYRVESDVSAVLLNRKFFQGLLGAMDSKQLSNNETIETLRTLAEKPYLISLYKGNSLIFWNKSGLIIEPDYLSGNQFPTLASDHLADFVLKRYEIYNERTGYQAFAKIPVIPANFREHNISVIDPQNTGDRGTYLIKTQEGTPVCALQFHDEKLSFNQQVILFIFYLIAFFTFLALIHHLISLWHTGKPNQRAALFICTSVIARLGSLFIPYHGILNDLDILEPISQGNLINYSLADYFLDSLLATILILYWHSKWQYQRHEKPPSSWIAGLTSGGHYLFMVLSIGLFAWIQRYLLIESSLAVDLENIAFFDYTHLILFFGIGIMSFSLFLVCEKLLREITQLEPNIYRRIRNMILACVLSVPALFLLKLGLPNFGFYLAILIFLLLLDFYQESRSKSVIWVISWIMLIAGFSAVLLFKFQLDRDHKHRNDLAFSIVHSLEDSANIEGQVLEWLPYLPAQYSLGIFREKQLSYSYNASYPMLLNSEPGSGEEISELWESRGRSEIGVTKKNFTVLIGKKAETLMSVVSLFSYLFTIFSILLFLIALLNSFIPFLPASINLTLSPKPSLSNRIQVAIVFLIILSFIIIGFVTVFYLRNSSSDRNKRLFEDRIRTITASLLQAIPASEEPTSLYQFVPKIAGIAYANNRQAKIYDAAGELLITQRAGSRSNKRIAVKMSFLSKLALDFSSRNFIVEESNNTPYSSHIGYIALRNDQGVLGYVALPLSSRGLNQDDVSARFFATLLNAYVFLFLIAVALAIAVANSITRPLSELADKLKQFNIGKKNEPLQWNIEDEIGTLIGDYNEMIHKLDESAQILARTERDLAWREMAKQVAHEIKNPLTPMKLSIQYLQNSLKGEQDELRAKAERVSSTLLEQIENLSTIASEFSNFATMPIAENEKIVLNDVVASVHDLFRKRDDMDISLYVPIEDISVFADKNQLIRVLNNILKNAIQAIPDDKRGEIEISLRRSGESAIIEVRDNGVGIPKEMEDKVFTPNFTTKTSGTGLGLAISANIVEAFNGRIYFKTSAGRGTSFYIEIPMMRAEGGYLQNRVVL